MPSAGRVGRRYESGVDNGRWLAGVNRAARGPKAVVNK